ncbi:NIPA-like protein 3 [Perkinsus chesapeaki]|uniref:NIPA-like protein 3 n=1 Tax=Perkinsus chesapeaki TaxID=330153 RepID=A0A7J6M969_PERCH|nr:NIPA-like protein 3 [Perkinsus chesapeaki]
MTTAWGFALGICVNIAGAVTTNLGTVLMKFHAAVRNGHGPWLKVGLLLFCIGSILTFSSFALAPQSLLAGVSAVQFVSNLLFARFLLGEKFTISNITGTVIIIMSIVLLVVASVETENPSSVDEIFDDYYFSFTHLYFIIGLVSLCSALSFAFWIRTGVLVFWLRKSPKAKRLQWELSLPRSQGRYTRFVLPLLYSTVAASLGGQSVVAGKVLAMVLAAGIVEGEPEELYQPRTFLVLALWVLAALFWVIHLNRALRFFPGAFVVPLTQVCWTLATMLSGGIVFEEFQQMDPWQLALFFTAAAVLFFGVFLLSPRKGTGASERDQATGDICADEAATIQGEPATSAEEAVAAAPPPPLPPLGVRRLSTGSDNAGRQQSSMTHFMSAISIDAARDVHSEDESQMPGSFIFTPRAAAAAASSSSELQQQQSTARTREGGRHTVTLEATLEDSGDVEASFPDPPYIKMKRWWCRRRRARRARRRRASSGSASKDIPSTGERSSELSTPKEAIDFDGVIPDERLPSGMREGSTSPKFARVCGAV